MALDKKIIKIHLEGNMDVSTYFMARSNDASLAKNILQVKGWATMIMTDLFGRAVPDSVLHMYIIWGDNEGITGKNKAFVCEAQPLYDIWFIIHWLHSVWSL